MVEDNTKSVLVEDASNDDGATLVAQTIFEDPIFLTTNKDGPSHSMVEDNTESVLMEDASDDEGATLVAQTTFEDPIFLMTIEDVPSLAMVEDNTKPQLVKDPPIETMSSSTTRAREDEDLVCPSLAPPSPSTTIVRRRRKSYISSSLRQSVLLAKRGVFKHLGIVGIDGKPNEGSIQACADHLKELLPPDLLKQLLSLKGRAFWDCGGSFFTFSLDFVFVVLGVFCCLLV
jgi:hypothetical protein